MKNIESVMKLNKTLVIFFSYTNNTRKIVDLIKSKIECDVLEIKTKTPYSNNYDEVVNDPNNQEDSSYIPEIENIDINLDSYSKIIIGTPTWWYRPTPAIRSFLTKYKLKQDSIFAFSTNAGWLGKTFTELHELCPNFLVKNGFNIEFKSYSDELRTKEDDILKWISNISQI